MLYNGVELPDIESVYTPELKATHPYAFITELKAASLARYTLHLCASMYTKIHTDYTNEWALFAVDVLTTNIMLSETEWRTLEVYYNGTMKVCDYGSDYVMWSNHSFYGEYGEEWITATDPVPVEDAFAKGYKTGAELRKKRVLPVAYLYNDIPLPKQPVWDKEAEPYAVIFQNSAKNYCLWTGSSPVEVLNSGKVNGMFLEYRVAERWQWREKSKPLISTDAPLWANYDVYNSDGTTLLLAASDPTPLFTYPVFDDWLYNGEVFPALPEWDKTNYPYAFISNGSLVVTKTLPHYHNDEYPRMAWDIADGVHAIRYSANGMRTEWNAPYSMNGAVNYQEGAVTWANFDVYGTDGTLYLAASNPIPVHK